MRNNNRDPWANPLTNARSRRGLVLSVLAALLMLVVLGGAIASLQEHRAAQTAAAETADLQRLTSAVASVEDLLGTSIRSVRLPLTAEGDRHVLVTWERGADSDRYRITASEIFEGKTVRSLQRELE